MNQRINIEPENESENTFFSPLSTISFNPKYSLTESELSILGKECPSFSYFLDVQLKMLAINRQCLSPTLVMCKSYFLQQAFLNLLIENGLIVIGDKIATNVVSEVGHWINSFPENSVIIITKKFKNFKESSLHLLRQYLEEYSFDVVIGKGSSARSVRMDGVHSTTFFLVDKREDVPDILLPTVDSIIDLNQISDEILLQIQLKRLLNEYNLQSEEDAFEMLIKEALSSKTDHKVWLTILANHIENNNLERLITSTMLNQVLGHIWGSGKNKEINMDQMEAFEFEELIYSLFKGLGYSCNHVGEANRKWLNFIAIRDDVRIGINILRSANPIGEAAIQNTIDGMIILGLDRAFILTNNVLSPKAQKLVSKSRITVWDYDTISRKLDEMRRE